MSPSRRQQRTGRARQLRKDSTIPERLLWGQLRARRLAGLKFHRQRPFDRYVLDFYCEEHKLAIELDGDSHIGQALRDLERQRFIEGQGVRVLRFGNDEVIREMDSVLAAILIACGIRP
jgi:very-short-patch-repair endonuclease